MTETRGQKRLRDYFATEITAAENGMNENLASESEINQNDQAENNLSKKRRLNIPRLLDGTFFSIVKTEGSKIVAKCSNCGKERKGEITSTGNFMDHIKKWHPGLVEKAEAYRKNLDEGKAKAHKATIRDMLTTFTQHDVCL